MQEGSFNISALVKGFNKYKIDGSIAIIYLEKRDKTFTEGIVDADDIPKLIELNLCWHIMYDKRNYYIQAGERYTDKNGKRKGRSLQLYRIVMDITNRKSVVDHINHNTLDNRKENLRVVEIMQNSKNRGSKNSNNSSGYRNVFWSNKDNRWLVMLQVDGKSTCLGRFKLEDIDKAGETAEKMREKYYGEFKGLS